MVNQPPKTLIPDARKPHPRDLWRVNRLTHESFQPYVTAIGQASLSWNNLQDNIGDLFSTIAGIEAHGDSGILLTIWHAIDSDRTQRKLLSAASNRMLEFRKITEQMHKDIKWMLKEVDKLSDSRNDIIHSPLMSLTNAEDELNSKIRVGSPFNRRSQKLSKKDILTEMHLCTKRAVILTDFCLEMRIGIVLRDKPWPDRPK